MILFIGINTSGPKHKINDQTDQNKQNYTTIPIINYF